MVARKKAAPKPRAKKSPAAAKPVVKAADVFDRGPDEPPLIVVREAPVPVVDGANATETPPAEAEPTPPAEPAPEGMVLVHNILPGTTLSLGDGRSIAHEEGAHVTPALAAFLRDRGQVA